MTGTSKTLAWNSTGSREITTLTLSGTITLAADSLCYNFAGNGSLALNAKVLYLRPKTNDFWTFTGSITGNGDIYLLDSVTTSLTNTSSMNMGTGKISFRPKINDVSLTVTGNFTTSGFLTWGT